MINMTVRISPITAIGMEAFRGCEKLKRVTFAEGSRLEKIGAGCFKYSDIEEITFPGTLREIGEDALYNCRRLRVVWVEDGCVPDVRNYVKDDVVVLSTNAMVGDKLLRDLRQFSEVVIPEGVEKIGGHWFSHSDIESVTVSRSVRVIEGKAFCECRKLKSVLI